MMIRNAKLVCVVAAICITIWGLGFKDSLGGVSVKPHTADAEPALDGPRKLVCFGRYALSVPANAELILGRISVPDDVVILEGGAESLSQHVLAEVDSILSKGSSAEIISDDSGPVQDSRQIRYFPDKYSKAARRVLFSTFVSIDVVTFMVGDAVASGETIQAVADRQARLARSLRLLQPGTMPTEPGICIGPGFIAGNQYERQEIAEAGIFIPSHPDVTFSISSNKNAYAEYSIAQYQKMKIDELPLLKRIDGAKILQGNNYPKRVLIREGVKFVQHWRGEESLIRRADGAHDFEWAFVGTPKDVANPSEFRVKMFTKVAHNVVGAAAKASLTDEQAVGLWDELLSSLKFRVKVPGAPEGSYYSLPNAVATKGAQP